jgi:hypothetical protein
MNAGHLTAPARPAGNELLLEWARALDSERVRAIEGVRNVSGSLQRFLIDRGETVVRLAPQLMQARVVARDPAGSLIRSTRSAIACAALREGPENRPTGRP